MSNPHRLGSQMPYWLRRQCEQPNFERRNFDPPKANDDFKALCRKMMVRGVIPTLELLLSKSTTSSKAAFCHSETVQVTNFSSDGGFCCYRGLQMLVSYLHATNHPSSELFGLKGTGVPSIIQLQTFIEDGFVRLVRWGRAELPRTIALLPLQNNHEQFRFKGTQKAINLFHAWMLLQSRGVRCQVRVYSRDERGSPVTKLCNYFERYFEFDSKSSDKVLQTRVSPVLLIRPHHSIVVVGIRHSTSGQRQLIVFDPSRAVPKFIRNRASMYQEQPVEEQKPVKE